MKRLLIPVSLLLLLVPVAFGQAQIGFLSRIVEVNPDGDDPTVGNLRVEVISGLNMLILVDESTEIEDEDGEPITLSELVVGSYVKIKGVFISEGILALEIEVGHEESDEIKGIIDSVDPVNRVIEIGGFEILVPVEAEIKDSEGNPRLFGYLAIGQKAKAEGNFEDSQFVASEVKLLGEGSIPARITLQGIVSSIDGDEFDLDLPGGVPSRVRVTPETIIRGDLAVGKLVRVKGILGEDLIVEASRVDVLSMLRLSPPKLKMKPGTTRTVNAVLRFEPEEDVELPLVSDDPDIAAPTAGSVVIPAGMYTASFEVMAGETEGETTLHVGSGNLMEHLEVSVSENPGGGPGQKVYWQPKRVNMDFESLRWVVLRLKESAEEAVDIALVQIEGGDGIVVFQSSVSVPAGELIVPVGLASGTLPGKVKIQAILPESQGGDTDEITVEIRDKEASKRRLEWEPDEIETGPNQTVSATLRLSEPAPYDLKVILSSRPKDVLLVSFPSEVTIPEEETEVQVEFEIGGKAGKVQIRAGLPFQKGGGNAKLKIEIED